MYCRNCANPFHVDPTDCPKCGVPPKAFEKSCNTGGSNMTLKIKLSSIKSQNMKLVRVVMFFVSASALLSCGDGVATLESRTNNNAGAATVTDGNNNAIAPGTNTNNPGVNPAHGAPGHRCDIAVGAPLTGNLPTQPSTVVNPVTATTPVSTNPTSTLQVPIILPDLNTTPNSATNISPTTQTVSGLNPPHGQPGHRCDIAVGKPLNGTASTLSTPTLPSGLPTFNSPTVTPPASSTVAPGMNPAHGQPGHRCDIPVGKPLNSKPAQ
jgi:hypothetical protein